MRAGHVISGGMFHTNDYFWIPLLIAGLSLSSSVRPVDWTPYPNISFYCNHQKRNLQSNTGKTDIKGNGPQIRRYVRVCFPRLIGFPCQLVVEFFLTRLFNSHTHISVLTVKEEGLSELYIKQGRGIRERGNCADEATSGMRSIPVTIDHIFDTDYGPF